MYKDSFASGELAAELGVTLQSADGAKRSRIAGLLGTLISLALLVVVVLQFRGMEPRHVVSMIPASSLFWMVFAGWYLAGPASEWVIYRRLWRIPLSGIGALMRKMVSSELLLGYLGEVQFYGWARGRLNLTA